LVEGAAENDASPSSSTVSAGGELSVPTDNSAIRASISGTTKMGQKLTLVGWGLLSGHGNVRLDQN
jgi:hypothetical protein